MTTFVRKRLSEVFHKDEPRRDGTTAERRLSDRSKADSGYQSIRENVSSPRRGSINSKMILDHFDRRTAAARDSLDLLRSSTSLKGSPRSVKTISKSSIRHFTANTMKRLSESIKSKRHIFYSDVDLLSDSDSDPPTKQLKPTGKDNNQKNRRSLKKRFSFDVKKAVPIQEARLERSPASLASNNRNYGMIASLRRKAYNSPKRSRGKCHFSRRRSESDKPRQKHFGQISPFARPPKLELDLPSVGFLSPQEKKLIKGTSVRTVSQPISMHDTKSPITDPLNKGLANQPETSKSGDHSCTPQFPSAAHTGRLNQDSVPSHSQCLSASLPWSAYLHGGESVFFQGQRDGSLDISRPSPLRRQMLRRSQSETYQSVKGALSHGSPRIVESLQTSRDMDGHANDSGCLSLRDTGSEVKSEQASQESLFRWETIPSTVAETAPDSGVPAELALHRCQAHQGWFTIRPVLSDSTMAGSDANADLELEPQLSRAHKGLFAGNLGHGGPTPANTESDIDPNSDRGSSAHGVLPAEDLPPSSYTKPFQKMHFPMLHASEHAVAEASSARLSSSSVYSELRSWSSMTDPHGPPWIIGEASGGDEDELGSSSSITDPNGPRWLLSEASGDDLDLSNSQSLQGSALDTAIEAIERTSGYELSEVTVEDSERLLEHSMRAFQDDPNPPRLSIDSLPVQASSSTSISSDSTAVSCAITTRCQPKSEDSWEKVVHHKRASIEALEACKEPVSLSEELKQYRQACLDDLDGRSISDGSFYSGPASAAQRATSANFAFRGLSDMKRPANGSPA